MTTDHWFEQIGVMLVDVGVFQVLAGACRQLGAGIKHHDIQAPVDKLACERGADGAGADNQNVGLVRRHFRGHLSSPRLCRPARLSRKR